LVLRIEVLGENSYRLALVCVAYIRYTSDSLREGYKDECSSW